MAFKSVKEIKATKSAGKFILENDGDYAFVIFMYRSQDEVLAGPTHYVKSNEYSGYVHCNEGGCPACAKGLRVQTKMFVPMWVIEQNGQSVNELQFWDRNMTFEHILSQAVFKNFPDPSLYVFKITRNGAFRSKETTYSITVAANNKTPFDQICAENNLKFPNCYEMVCKDVDAATLNQWLAAANMANVSANTGAPAYVATPRVNVGAPTDLPNVLVEAETEFTDDDMEISDEVDFGV